MYRNLGFWLLEVSEELATLDWLFFMTTITGIRGAGASFSRCGMSSVVHPTPHHSLLSSDAQRLPWKAYHYYYYYYYYGHIADEETEVQRGKVMGPRFSSYRWWSGI